MITNQMIFKHSNISLAGSRIGMQQTISQAADKNLNPDANKTATVNESANARELNRIKREPADVNFCGLSGSDSKFLSGVKKHWKEFVGACGDKFKKSENVKKILSFANEHQLIFGASFALLLTCVLRPASIMVAPSKKNKEDQIYASAHSIASGIIGFIISNLMFYPVENGLKKVTDGITNIKKEIKEKPENEIKYPFGLTKDSYLLKNEKQAAVATTILGRVPDILGSVPKGILTIVLIPPILKYCFGWEKKPSAVAKTPVDSVKKESEVK